MLKRFAALVILISLLLPLISGSCTSTPTPAAGQAIDAKRGDLNVIVTSDGSITAPKQYNLAFNSPQGGIVQSILVEYGDNVRQGALLATIEPWKQINDIKTALFSVQTAQNNMDLGCNNEHLPYNYPDLSVNRMADEAIHDLDTAVDFFKVGNYKEAGYWLIMTYFDVQVCENLIATRPNAAQLAGAKNNSTWSPDIDAGDWQPLKPDDLKAITLLKAYRAKLVSLSNLMKDPSVPYNDIVPEFEKARRELSEVSQVAKRTVTIKSRMIFKYADTPTSVDFLQSSLRFLEELQHINFTGEISLRETLWDLYAARLNLLLGKDILETQTLTFESGGNINWKTLQDYNLQLQKAEITLKKTKRDIMGTVIIAPSDGTIFSVNLKKYNLLSSEDYATRPAVGLVNTKIIKFTGKVDEIDIMKVHVGDNATVKVDAIPDREFHWKVKFISPFGAKDGNVVKFDVIIVPVLPYENEFKDGMRATAEVTTASVKNALLVPISAIINTPGGPMVLLVDGKTGQAQPKRITTGLQNFQYAEVTSGLTDGDKIQMPGKAAIGAGTGQRQQPGSNPMRALR